MFGMDVPHVYTHRAMTDAAEHQRAETGVREGADQADLAELGKQIKERREALGIGLRTLAETVGITAPYLSSLENGPSDPTRRRSKPDKDIVRGLAFQLRVNDAGPWLQRAGYSKIADTWGSMESAFYLVNLSSDDPIKPGTRLHFERMEDDLPGFLREPGVVLAEVPVYAFLRHLVREGGDPEFRIVGVPMRCGQSAGVFAALAARDDVLLRDVRDLAGHAVATIGVYTEALVLLLKALDRSGTAWTLNTISKSDEVHKLEIERSTDPDAEPVRILITYNSGALIHLLRAGQADVILVPPSPFELWKVESDRWVVWNPDGSVGGYEKLVRVLDFALARGYRNYPSTLLVTTEKTLADPKWVPHIIDTIREIELDNEHAVRLQRHDPIEEDDGDDIFRLDPRPDIEKQFQGVFIDDADELAQQLRELSRFASTVPELCISVIQPEDDLDDCIVSEQRLHSSNVLSDGDGEGV